MSLNEQNILSYWQKRATSQGERTVGNGGLPMSVQDKEYEEKAKHVFSVCPQNLYTLDYGCGIGRYAPFFERYAGGDITESLLAIARSRNPEKRFFNLTSPIGHGIPDDVAGQTELLFFSTVLQHCSDEVCLKILSSVIPALPKLKAVFMYENSVVGESWHVKGRGWGDYGSLLNRAGQYHSSIFFSEHKVHNEEHCASIFWAAKI